MQHNLSSAHIESADRVGQSDFFYILRYDVVNDMAVYISQTEVTSLISICQTFVVDAEQMQDGGVQVVDVHGAGSELAGRWLGIQRVAVGIGDVVSVVVRTSVGDAGFHSTASHPDGETSWMMIASVVLTG